MTLECTVLVQMYITHFFIDNSVGFPTNPKDSTGVAHILEHTALCGSKRFPVRDPFFKMLTRSLSTFMNAFTGTVFVCVVLQLCLQLRLLLFHSAASDWTMYPFSTQNDKDFHNLLSVYLDSVLHPQLRLVDFRCSGLYLLLECASCLFLLCFPNEL